MSSLAKPASATALVLVLIGCATKRQSPPDTEAAQDRGCTEECQAHYATCSAGCGQLTRISEIFEWGRPQTCLQDCKLQLEDCYASCK